MAKDGRAEGKKVERVKDRKVERVKRVEEGLDVSEDEGGFLKGYRFEGDTVVLERYPTETLRIRAIELQRKIEKEIQEFIERFRKAVRESKRKRKQREKGNNQKQ
ncbi:MAG: hypothetical protein ACO2PP_10665 [Thermocrinis sp.]|uniref:hypothetical protein n=1 Tax=Thermocrinis sp. TaxID=2024383 RepID=UPI003C0C48D8